jgi:primosomal protein N'
VARELRKGKGVEVLGPAPTGAAGGGQEWRLLVRTARRVRVDSVLDRSRLSAPGVSVRVDIDPVEMF